MTTAREVMSRYAYQLQAEMDDQGLRQWMLGERAGMTQGRVSDILTGRYSDIRLSTMCRIAAAAGCELEITVKRRDP